MAIFSETGIFEKSRVLKIHFTKQDLQPYLKNNIFFLLEEIQGKYRINPMPKKIAIVTNSKYCIII